MEVNVEDKHIKRKKWVKRFAIIFFVIMLILTFFSNTIMNYSLPQVATQMVGSDTVSAKVRGTGTIEAADLKEVIVNESREVAEVLVEQGDVVKKDDVILRLKEGNSEELNSAEDNLKSLETSYQNNILVNEVEERLVSVAEKGGYEYSSTRAKLAELSGNIKSIENRITNIQSQINNISATQPQSNETSNYTGESMEDISGEGNLDDMPVSESVSNPELERLNKELEAANKELVDATKAHSDYIAEINTVNEIKSQYEAILKAREEVEKIKKNVLGNEVVAPIDGTVASVNVKAGERTMPETALATIQDSNNGYTLSFSVTNEQAKKVKVGDEASISNAWYYGDVKVTLKNIKNDPAMPGKQKLLVCTVSGEVNVGESMTVSLGEKSGTYDYVVPNSALREDNNGKFILVVKQKSSPLGNRYVAKRVDVEVIVSDDSKSAIKGAIEGGEYVITTSNKMINAGDLIRLAD